MQQINCIIINCLFIIFINVYGLHYGFDDRIISSLHFPKILNHLSLSFIVRIYHLFCRFIGDVSELKHFHMRNAYQLLWQCLTPNSFYEIWFFRCVAMEIIIFPLTIAWVSTLLFCIFKQNFVFIFKTLISLNTMGYHNCI